MLAGGAAPSPELDAFVDALRERAMGLNVSFEVNVPPQQLSDLLGQARLFWHAAGFQRPTDAPESAEHFGMSTVEAMSHGAVPLVYADGGQLEIVSADVGRLWRSVSELVEQTTELIEGPRAELDALSRAARTASEHYGSERFSHETRRLLRASQPRTMGRVRHAVRRVDRTRRRMLYGLYVQRGRLSARRTGAEATGA